jgi:hypothetical protein
MNQGTDLWTLMGEIQLPSDLQSTERVCGVVAWGVRATWERYTG